MGFNGITDVNCLGFFPYFFKPKGSGLGIALSGSNNKWRRLSVPQKETPTGVSRLENLGMYWNYSFCGLIQGKLLSSGFNPQKNPLNHLWRVKSSRSPKESRPKEYLEISWVLEEFVLSTCFIVVFRPYHTSMEIFVLK